MIIISDTSPINYLILIGEVDILEKLFGRVIIPQAVFNEVRREKTPPEVKAWISTAPAWLEVRQADLTWFTPTKKIGDGEREAIALAKELSADAILIDDRDGSAEARKMSLTVLSTITLLDGAAQRRLLDLPAAIDRLRQTTFRFPPTQIVEDLLKKDAERKQIERRE
jgi:predicted nucleic acid-binding protein